MSHEWPSNESSRERFKKFPKSRVVMEYANTQDLPVCRVIRHVRPSNASSHQIMSFQWVALSCKTFQCVESSSCRPSKAFAYIKSVRRVATNPVLPKSRDTFLSSKYMRQSSSQWVETRQSPSKASRQFLSVKEMRQSSSQWVETWRQSSKELTCMQSFRWVETKQRPCNEAGHQLKICSPRDKLSSIKMFLQI